MAGKFINTNVQNTINKIADSIVDKLDNKYIVMLQEKPVPIIFYNLNVSKSSVDKGSQLEYSHIGSSSPFRYDKIVNLFGYGLQRFQMELQETEFGVDMSDIDGEMTITPDTIIPMVNSYFTLPHLKYQCLFKILDVQQDTLDNGNNYYRIKFELDYDEESKIESLEKQVIKNFNVIYNNIGTEKRAIVTEEEYIIIDEVDNILLTLKKYFKALFYSQYVQTFIFDQNDTKLYDPCLIEFIIRNSLLMGDDQYTHVCHQTVLDNTFVIEYDKSFFRCLEKRDLFRIRKYYTRCMGKMINDITSIFSGRYEYYFMMSYRYPEQLEYNSDAFVIFPPDLIEAIENKTYYTEDKDLYKNIFIKFFNKEDISLESLNCIEYIDYNTSKELYYLIPMLIFCIEYYINEILNKHEVNK